LQGIEGTCSPFHRVNHETNYFNFQLALKRLTIILSWILITRWMSLFQYPWSHKRVFEDVNWKRFFKYSSDCNQLISAGNAFEYYFLIWRPMIIKSIWENKNNIFLPRGTKLYSTPSDSVWSLAWFFKIWNTGWNHVAMAGFPAAASPSVQSCSQV